MGKVLVEDSWHNVEHEGLHISCSKCGCYGHVSRDCKSDKQPMVAVNSSAAEGASEMMVETEKEGLGCAP